MLTLSEAAIFSTSLEAIFYGFSVFMFMLTTKTLFRGYGQRRLNYGMIVVAWALLLLSTAEMAVNIARLYRGFVSLGPKLAGGPEQYFAFTPDAMFLTKSCLYNAQTVILDAVMIYRAWVVWQNLRVIVIPVVGWCGLIATCFGLNISFAKQLSDIESQDLLGIPTGHWVAAAFSLTLFTNLVTTLIIAYRIWMVVRRSTDYLSQSSLTPVLCVIVESGAIYSVAITAALITFAAKSNYVFVILDLLSPIISIVFSMIIVRVGLSKERTAWPPPLVGAGALR
ncbi:hypothetical protein LXA43DRAFT_386764 [Ganoderma leucocontextum]|nr:hypothetical protein LXA43DRAFT_386764 [Ganoderma leucocontextum]